jgi:hypothetical protein
MIAVECYGKNDKKERGGHFETQNACKNIVLCKATSKYTRKFLVGF